MNFVTVWGIITAKKLPKVMYSVGGECEVLKVVQCICMQRLIVTRCSSLGCSGSRGSERQAAASSQ